MKRLIAILSVAVIITAFGATTAFAHGHQGGTGVSYKVCGVENCAQTGLHKHDGTYYKAHSVGDGHDYHGYCATSGCTLAGYHEHDGTYCFAHTSNDGHGHNRTAGTRSHH